MAQEGYISVPDSGKQVRNLVLTTYVNGTATTVETQVISIADSYGNVIDDFADYNWKLAVLKELRAIRQVLGDAHGSGQFLPEVDFSR